MPVYVPADKKRLVCQYCRRAYKSSQAKSNHVRRVHGEKGSDPRPGACKVRKTSDGLGPRIEANVPAAQVKQYYRCVVVLLRIKSYYSQSKKRIKK